LLNNQLFRISWSQLHSLVFMLDAFKEPWIKSEHKPVQTQTWQTYPQIMCLSLKKRHFVHGDMMVSLSVNWKIKASSFSSFINAPEHSLLIKIPLSKDVISFQIFKCFLHVCVLNANRPHLHPWLCAIKHFISLIHCTFLVVAY